MARGKERGVKGKGGAPPDPIAAEADRALSGEASELIRSLIGFQLRRAHTLFALHWQLSFLAEGIRVTPMEGGVLLAIENQPGLMQTTLAQIMDVEGPTLVAALDKLEEKGLVQRVRRVADRRSYALQLTDAGREAVTLVKAFVPDREAELLVDLSDEERTQLLGLLRRVVRRGQIVTAELSAQKRPAAGTSVEPPVARAAQGRKKS